VVGDSGVEAPHDVGMAVEVDVVVCTFAGSVGLARQVCDVEEIRRDDARSRMEATAEVARACRRRRGGKRKPDCGGGPSPSQRGDTISDPSVRR
jgi:hypothetical protein